MNKRALFVVLLFVASVALLFGLGATEKDKADSKQTNKQLTETSQEESLPYYTMEEVKQHAEAGECWMVIDDKVYDLTEFVNMHPGGKAILEGCGKDATKLFEERPMGSGTPHSNRARKLLENYLIGYLKSED